MKKNNGMTLVEVLIALAIFVTAFFAIIDAQNINIRKSSLAKRSTIATILAQEKLSEMILQYEGKPFSEIAPAEEATFEEPYSQYRWEKTSREFHYDLSFLAEMAKNKEESEEEESPLMAYLPKISEFIQKSSHEITVTVYWKEGSGERRLSLTTHLFNYQTPLPL